MDFAYFVRAAKFSLGKGKRVSDYHHEIFHGMGTFHGREDDTDWISPSATNEVRDVFHIWRSGTVVPSVFSPSFRTLVLSTAARKAIQGLTGLDFHPVVFEHVVDLAMPPLGSLSVPPYENESARELFDHVRMKQWLFDQPDEPTLHSRFEGYSQMLMGTLIEVEQGLTDLNLSDVERVEVNWGSYCEYTRSTVRFSRQMLEEYSVYEPGGSIWVMSEDAFAAIAPFLDREFFDIAAIDLRPKVVHPWEQPEELERRRLFMEQNKGKQ